MAISPQVQASFDWLVDGAPGAPTPMAVIERLASELAAAGVPLERMAAFVRTLHPQVMGRRFVWVPGKPVAVFEASWAMLNSEHFLQSTVAHVFQTGEGVRGRAGEATRFADVAGLYAEGFTDYLCLPLKFMQGSVHAVSYATRRPGGFEDAHVEALHHVTRPLARVGETLALMRTAANLLNTYVGRDAGDRILKGKIQRGDTEDIRAVVWFSDLRGFTTLSGERTPREVIAVLNELFDCQVPAIEKAGGEVLKFMGDGLLAIFPLKDSGDVADAGARALRASQDAFEALDQLNATRAARGEAPLRFGVALHVGDVAYGNIGGSSRLDFTCIGTTVNLASRIEGLTGKLDKRVLVSAELAGRLGVPTREVGTYPLKGVAQPQAVFEPG